MSNHAAQLPPGFRFHPTDEELIKHYLKNRAASTPLPVSIIAEVDIYKFDPWNLPAKAVFGEREWYFFSPRDRKYPNGVRPNRAAASGYWKATGTDKPISSGNENIGVKKALVFYKGRPPRGLKTDWIMHEYRLAESQSNNSCKPVKLGCHSMRLDDWVLCRIYKKRNHHSLDMVADQKQEDLYIEESCFQSRIKLPQTSFTADFLEEDYDSTLPSNHFDNLQELPRFYNNSFFSHPVSSFSLINQSTENSGNGYPQSQFSHAESPAFFGIKCQSESSLEDCSASLHPSKMQNDLAIFPNFSNYFDGTRNSLLN